MAKQKKNNMINFIILFYKLLNFLKFILFIALILSVCYLSYRIQVNITKEAIKEANQNK